MYIPAMLHSRHEIVSQFRTPEYVPHPRLPGIFTFPFLSSWPPAPLEFRLPLLAVELTCIDYLHAPEGSLRAQPLRFQQDGYRLWYQVDGVGVLQNLTTGVFGRAAPGLLGIMDPGHRFSYLHQRGPLECFLVDFSAHPGPRAHVYWNSAIEGKKMLPENSRLLLENSMFTLLRTIANDEDRFGMRQCALAAQILSEVFDGQLLSVRSEHFPADKSRSLVAMARAHMDEHYGSMQHQRSLHEACGVDINYLNVLFKRQTGTTLYQYLTSVRMEHAKHRLQSGQDAVGAIAAQVGYPNSNSFSRAFHRHTGMTPSEYAARHSPGDLPGAAPSAAVSSVT